MKGVKTQKIRNFQLNRSTCELWFSDLEMQPMNKPIEVFFICFKKRDRFAHSGQMSSEEISSSKVKKDRAPRFV